MKRQILLLLMLCLCTVSMYGSNKIYLVIGSYSNGNTSGISVYDFDIQSGEFDSVSDMKGIINPSYLAVSPDEKFIYSVNETQDGAVSAFSFDKKTGTLNFMNSQLTEGANPCYITIDKGQNFIVTANYSGGNVSYFPLTKDGTIEPLQKVWDMDSLSHIHTAVFSPDYQSLFVTDLGVDKIYKFNVKADYSLTLDTENTTSLPIGSGPRHLAFHPNGKFLYSINERNGTVTAFQYQNGILTSIQTIDSDINLDSKRKGSADIHLTPNGKFLYSSNRLREDGIAIFSVDSKKGTLKKVGYQKTGIHPRNFIISPNGKFLLCANRNSNNVQIFEINQKTGLLHDTGKEIVLNQPVCLKWISK
jgi:6-phosphogluconolactonase (cycloisomerase 2 family)